ncbi:HD domain-containing phosphohydrolase [Treponema sp. C6A8]|uniref:HD domain-containing phosphohydrolase n=1 Tax=Treponema sp. C6A8 TaxID=1410609 RepID=UPI0006845B8A|nr:HD domain-containing phosphohydrolase [Treponema sp. C6A8]
MKCESNLKAWQVFLLVFLSMALNLGGRLFADSLNLPLWLDSFGTFLTAYCLGPFCGAVVGVSGNILHGLFNPISFVYSLTSIFIAVVVGIMAKRGWLETLLKTMSLSVLVTLVCVLISVVLNIVFYGGDVGNEWGNGIVELFSSFGVPRIICLILGQFYMDFLDKVITLVLLFAVIRIYRVLKPNFPQIIQAFTWRDMVLFLLFAGFLLVGGEKLSAQSKIYSSYTQTLYNKSNGLNGGKANDIVSTDDGVLWIGTYEGLYRYNGIEFRLMTEFDSIKAVKCLYVDDDDRLFVGTNDNGLSIIINESIMNVIEESDGLPADAVRSIIRGSDGLYYVGTAEALAVLEIADGLGVVSTFPEIQTAISLAADKDEHIAAVSSAGTLFLFNNADGIGWTSKNIKERFISVAFTPEGLLYAATDSNKLLSYQVRGKELVFDSQIDCQGFYHINSVEFYNDTAFVCADNGIGCIENGKISLIESGNFNNSIDNMTEDYQGNFWFTSSRLGLLKMCENSFSEIYASADLPVSVVNSTAKYRGVLYFATDDGLMAVDAESERPLNNEITKFLKGVRCRCITLTKNGEMWISTKSRGLVKVFPDGRIITLGQGHLFRVAIELADGALAAGSSDGLALIKNDRIVQWLTVKDGFENSMVLCLSETPDGIILAGTDGGGLAVIEKEDEEGTYSISRLIKRSDGISSNVILRTVNDFEGENPTGKVFAVTSNGLAYLDFSEGAEKPIRILSNFPYSNNYDLIIRPDKNLFVLCSAGIYVVNRDELLSGMKLDYELLDSEKGLRGALTANSWNYLDENGDLYLSCDAGASKINLNTYDKQEHSYRMQLKSVVIDGRRHIVQKDIPFILSSETGTVEIVPEIINYSLNTPYVSLFLEGVDEKPSVMLQNELTSKIYTNIKSGEYKFHIAVLDSKGRRTVEESIYTIKKPFRIYDNWWFFIYTLGVAMLAIVWLTWYVTSALQEKRLEKQNKEMEDIKRQVRLGNETIFSIANALEARNESTGRHSMRVAEYAVLIAKELGFTEDEQAQLRRTGLLHDIGKIGVPDAILNKQSALNDDEYEIMKKHTIIGGAILKDFTLIPHVDEGAKYHHEHFDGTGYPNGLKGEKIPVNARIIGIADAFDAMTANRVYRKALDMDFVTAELKRSAGKQFDPCLVDIMLDLIESGKLNVEKTVTETDEVAYGASVEGGEASTQAF